jgi:transposase InsO family protein
MKYAFMEREQKFYSVEMMARMFKVSRSGYYSWKNSCRSKREQENEEIVKEITAIQKSVKYRYGSPRIIRELKKRGYNIGHNRVARLMKEHNLGRRTRKLYRSTTMSKHKLHIADNLLNRGFYPAKMDQVWASDISYIATSEGWLYLCVVIDLYSRKVIGWSLSTRLTADMVVRAFLTACMNRKPPKGMIFHSDRGSQYCSGDFRDQLSKYKIRQSMSRKGDCWDNAPVESFFKTIKTELCGSKAFRNRKEARMAIFEYIEVFYNRIRLHSTIGYLSPAEFERKCNLDRQRHEMA